MGELKLCKRHYKVTTVLLMLLCVVYLDFAKNNLYSMVSKHIMAYEIKHDLTLGNYVSNLASGFNKPDFFSQKSLKPKKSTPVALRD